jgi:hypothetical protein
MLAGALGVASLGGIAAGAAAVTATNPFAQHAAQAGIKQCATVFPALGGLLTQGATYSVETKWNTKSPDAHAVQGLVGMAYDGAAYKGKAVGVVYATPAVGGCAGQMVRVAPFPKSCAEVTKTLPTGTVLAKSLSDTPLFNLGGGGGQAMLLPAGQNCVVVSIASLG